MFNFVNFLVEESVGVTLVIIQLIDNVGFKSTVGGRFFVYVELIVSHCYHIARYADDPFNQQFLIVRGVKCDDLAPFRVSPLCNMPRRKWHLKIVGKFINCLLYTSPSPRD